MSIRSGNDAAQRERADTNALLPLRGKLWLLLGMVLFLIGQAACQADQTSLKLSGHNSNSITLKPTSGVDTVVRISVINPKQPTSEGGPVFITLYRKDNIWTQKGYQAIDSRPLQPITQIVIKRDAQGNASVLIIPDPNSPIVLHEGDDVRVTYDTSAFDADGAVPEEPAKHRTPQPDPSEKRKISTSVIVGVFAIICLCMVGLFFIIRTSRNQGSSDTNTVNSQTTSIQDGQNPPKWPSWSLAALFSGQFSKDLQRLYANERVRTSQLDRRFDSMMTQLQEIVHILGADRYDLQQDTIADRLRVLEADLGDCPDNPTSDAIRSRVIALEKALPRSSLMLEVINDQLDVLADSIGNRGYIEKGESLQSMIRALELKKVSSYHLDDDLLNLLNHLKNQSSSIPSDLLERLMADMKRDLDIYRQSLEGSMESDLVSKKDAALYAINEKLAEYALLQEAIPTPQVLTSTLQTVGNTEIQRVKGQLQTTKEDAITEVSEAFSKLEGERTQTLTATASSLEASLKAHEAAAIAARNQAEGYKSIIEALVAEVKEIRQKSQTRVDELEEEKEAARIAAARAEAAAREAVAQVDALRAQIDSMQRLDQMMQTLQGAVNQIQSNPRTVSEALPVPSSEGRDRSVETAATQPGSEAEESVLPPALTRGHAEFDYLKLVSQIMQAEWADIMNAVTNNDARYFAPRILTNLDTVLYGDPAKLLGARPEYQNSIADLAEIVRAGQRKAIKELESAGMKRIGIPGECVKAYWIEVDPNVEGEVTEDVAKKGTLIEILPGKGGYDLKGRALRPSLGRFYV